MDERLIEDGCEGSAHIENVPRPRVVAGRIAAFVLGSMAIVASVASIYCRDVSHVHTLGSKSYASHASLDASDAFSKCYGYLGVPDDKTSSLGFKPKLSAVLTADPGIFSGVSEAHHILANLIGRRDKPKDETVCGGVSSGVLLGRPAIVVTTGIGPSAASMCTLEVMNHCGPILSEVVYFGTSGWSPQPGGILNPPECGEANWGHRVARMGDICVSPLSVNWACHKGSWAGAAAAYPDQCYEPKESNGPADDFLFGQCQFYKDNIKGNLDLADDVIAAVKKSTSFPPRSVNVTAQENIYWSTMAEGVHQPMPSLPHDTPPNVWEYDECMEVDAQFFYSGSPFEFKARQYAAETLNAAIDYLGLGHMRRLKTRDIRGSLSLSSSPLSAKDVIAVTAMEAVGVSEALLRYNSLTGVHPVPFTNIRTLSNWNVQPITRDNEGRWVSFKDLQEDFVTGYSHAIATGSIAILSYHQARCLSDPAISHSACQFEIDPLQIERLLRLGRQARQ